MTTIEKKKFSFAISWRKLERVRAWKEERGTRNEENVNTHSK